jgi:hypothetical protein
LVVEIVATATAKAAAWQVLDEITQPKCIIELLPGRWVACRVIFRMPAPTPGVYAKYAGHAPQFKSRWRRSLSDLTDCGRKVANALMDLLLGGQVRFERPYDGDEAWFAVGAGDTTQQLNPW